MENPLVVRKVAVAERSQSLNITFLELQSEKIKTQLGERFYLLLRVIELISLSSVGRELH